MTTTEGTLSDIAAAARDLLTAVEEVEAARERRDDAIWRLVNNDGVPGKQAPDVIRAYLLQHGFTEEQIEGAGMSYGSVRLAMRARRAR